MPMPGGDEIQNALRASWRLMQGKPDAVRQLDLSADGFWNSFFAFVVAIPPLFVFWTGEAIEQAPAAFGERVGIILRLIVIEAASWAGPILLIAYGLYRFGRHDRVAAVVVANNWGGALLAWFILPVILITAILPTESGLGPVLMLLMLIAVLVLSWRLNNAVLNMGPVAPSLVLAASFGLSVAIDYALRTLFALPTGAQPG